MTANYSLQLSNYANFRIFSETLHANLLDAEFEDGIMNFRENHRGTMTGMTRFRHVIDDMPILGYGWSALSHDRIESFHRLLAGHSANYLGRGMYWGTEQRLQLGVNNFRSRNGGSGGEYGSLCMVSSIPVSMWVRWMLVQEDMDQGIVHIARGAPRRWFQQVDPFGIDAAPTRFGVVSFTLQPADNRVEGQFAMTAHPNGVVKDALYYVHVRAGKLKQQMTKVVAVGANVVSWSSDLEVVVLKPTKSKVVFTAYFDSVARVVLT